MYYKKYILRNNNYNEYVVINLSGRTLPYNSRFKHFSKIKFQFFKNKRIRCLLKKI